MPLPFSGRAVGMDAFSHQLRTLSPLPPLFAIVSPTPRPGQCRTLRLTTQGSRTFDQRKLLEAARSVRVHDLRGGRKVPGSPLLQLWGDCPFTAAARYYAGAVRTSPAGTFSVWSAAAVRVRHCHAKGCERPCAPRHLMCRASKTGLECPRNSVQAIGQ